MKGFPLYLRRWGGAEENMEIDGREIARCDLWVSYRQPSNRQRPSYRS